MLLFSFQCSDMPLLAERSTVDRNLKKRISCQSLGIFRLETGNFLLSYDSECPVAPFEPLLCDLLLPQSSGFM